ncbi:MAG: pilus assembly protein TadG-related protein [Actinomycetota bacterium]
MKFKSRARDESGAILVIVAISMIALLTLSAGGIMLFTLYGANREMQKAADQAALAGAAALPLLRPNQLLSSLPLNPVYDLTSNVGLDVPLKGLSNVPHPFAVACAYGTNNLKNTSARLISVFGSPANPPLGGHCASAPWSDGRVLPALNSLSSPLSTCVNTLTTRINGLVTTLQSELNSLIGGLGGLLGGVLGLLGLSAGQATDLVNNTITQLTGLLTSVQNLESLSPALLTPEMTVTVRSGVQPPMLSFITGSNGVQMTVQATAERRLKNAVVLPSTPGLGVDLNTALDQTKPAIMSALNAANTQLNTVMSQLNIPGCQNLLSATSKIVQDVSDIYNPPPGGPSPTGRDLIEGSLTAAQQAAASAGTNINNLAGEAVLVIRQGPTPSTLSSLLGPLINILGPVLGLPGITAIPALDVVGVAAHNLEDGNISNADLIPDLLAARGLFTATLVK